MQKIFFFIFLTNLCFGQKKEKICYKYFERASYANALNEWKDTFYHAGYFEITKEKKERCFGEKEKDDLITTYKIFEDSIGKTSCSIIDLPKYEFEDFVSISDADYHFLNDSLVLVYNRNRDLVKKRAYMIGDNHIGFRDEVTDYYYDYDRNGRLIHIDETIFSYKSELIRDSTHRFFRIKKVPLYHCRLFEYNNENQLIINKFRSSDSFNLRDSLLKITEYFYKNNQLIESCEIFHGSLDFLPKKERVFDANVLVKETTFYQDYYSINFLAERIKKIPRKIKRKAKIMKYPSWKRSFDFKRN